MAPQGALACYASAGFSGVAAGRHWQGDLIARIHSMTKPVTDTALTMLIEETRMYLDDPVEAHLPEFKDQRLLIPGATSRNQTVPVGKKFTIHHRLTHTSGLSLFTNPACRVTPLPASALVWPFLAAGWTGWCAAAPKCRWNGSRGRAGSTASEAM